MLSRNQSLKKLAAVTLLLFVFLSLIPTAFAQATTEGVPLNAKNAEEGKAAGAEKKTDEPKSEEKKPDAGKEAPAKKE